MGDIIKELNIVDFLGIIVPGSLLVLLIAGDNAQLLLWADYFGSDASVWVRAAFLLIAGYLAGMLLHEIGDLLEKGAWCFHVLDPKAYAANAIGVKEIEDSMVKVGILTEERPWQTFTYVFPPSFKGFCGTVAAAAVLGLSTCGFCFAMDKACQVIGSVDSDTVGRGAYWAVFGIMVAVILIILCIARTLCNRYARCAYYGRVAKDPWNAILQMARQYQEHNDYDQLDWNTLAQLAAVRSNQLANPVSVKASSVDAWRAILQIAQKALEPGGSANSIWDEIAELTLDTGEQEPSLKKVPTIIGSWKSLHNVCVLNPAIQTYVTSCGVHVKQSMFDSFRHVMRNMIICIAIINLYSIWNPVEVYQDIARYFIGRGNAQMDFLWLCICFAATIVIMFSRYSHFVFLRYKYGFESFVEKAKKHDESKEDDIKTYRIHILSSDTHSQQDFTVNQ